MRFLSIAIYFNYIFQCVTGFSVKQTLAFQRNANKNRDVAMSAVKKLHGGSFKFLPSSQLKRTEHAPRTIQIAGVFPGLTIDQLFSPKSTPASPQGTWTYDFSDPEGPQLGNIRVDNVNMFHLNLTRAFTF